MTIRIHYRFSLLLAVSGLAMALLSAGCQSAPPKGNPANDPAGLGSPQERLEKLKANTAMDPRLKARKMRIIQDEINGTSTPPGPH
jgi:hypothetical protein